MRDFQGKNILVGICGGIAACKSVLLVRELVKLGASVRVVLTPSAREFVTPLSLQALSGNPVHESLLDTEAERAMGHIALARWADAIVIAPATAHTMAKLAHGLADDLLTTLCLVAEVPLLLAPGMNHSMWQHPATRANRTLLKARGVRFVGPDSGALACGEEGDGRMSEVEDILDALRLLSLGPVLKGQHVLITAGPTREAIDPVRFVSNHSSGRMGYALARAAHAAGARVTLISGPCSLRAPQGVDTVGVESAQQMLDAVMRHLCPGSLFIGCAAVADFRPQSVHAQKMPKSAEDHLSLEMETTPDIIARVAADKRAACVVGFAAQTHEVLPYARKKRVAKGLDVIIANQVGEGMGFGATDNAVTVIDSACETSLPLTHKTRLAGEIIAILATRLQNVALNLQGESHGIPDTAENP